AFAIAAPVAVNIGHMEITPTLQVMGGLQTAKPQPTAKPDQSAAAKTDQSGEPNP
ncbi:SDR family NAD(P)-dependent oxidoreductase, partial [Rhizobium ruizarguesonis]